MGGRSGRFSDERTRDRLPDLYDPHRHRQRPRHRGRCGYSQEHRPTQPRRCEQVRRPRCVHNSGREHNPDADTPAHGGVHHGPDGSGEYGGGLPRLRVPDLPVIVLRHPQRGDVGDAARRGRGQALHGHPGHRCAGQHRPRSRVHLRPGHGRRGCRLGDRGRLRRVLRHSILLVSPRQGHVHKHPQVRLPS